MFQIIQRILTQIIFRRKVHAHDKRPYQTFIQAVKYKPSAEGGYNIDVKERIVEVPFVFGCLAAFPKGSQILELGCAQSHTAISLASLGYQVTGVDLTEYDLEHPNFHFVQGDFLEVSLAGGFDAFIAILVLEHSGLEYYGDRKRESADVSIMKRAHTLLKPGGQLIITVPFGIRKVVFKNGKPFQRIYDYQALRELMSPFVIQEERFFYTENRKYWGEGAKEQVEKIETDCRTMAVILVRAIKAK